MQSALDDRLLTPLQCVAEPWLVLDGQGVVQCCNAAAVALPAVPLSPGMPLPLLQPVAETGSAAALPPDMMSCVIAGQLFGLLPLFSGSGLRTCRIFPLQSWHDMECERAQRERYLRILSDLAASNEKDRLHRLDIALKAGAAALGMETGFVARCDDVQLEVVACHDEVGLARGDVLPLELTYCKRTLADGRLLCIPDVLESELADSACYRELRLRSYIGLPLLIDGQVFGTLAFCARRPRAAFNAADTEFVQHLVRWVAVVLERKLAADALTLSHRAMHEQLGWLRLAGQVARLGHWSYTPQSGQVSLSSEACRLLELASRPLMPLAEVERRMVLDDRQRWRDALQESLNRRVPLALDVRLRRGGGTGWLSLRAQVVERDGEPLLFGVLMDITETKESQQLIQYQASHDALTGCINRTLLFDRLSQEIRRAERLQQQFALMFIDLDRFKQVNDRYGHAAGDKVLQVVADRLMTVLRRSDTVARVGGDEFVLLIPSIGDGAMLHALEDKVQAALDLPVRDGEACYQVSGSIGIALYPGDGAEPEVLLQAADRRMYGDKSGPASL